METQSANQGDGYKEKPQEGGGGSSSQQTQTRSPRNRSSSLGNENKNQNDSSVGSAVVNKDQVQQSGEPNTADAVVSFVKPNTSEYNKNIPALPKHSGAMSEDESIQEDRDYESEPTPSQRGDSQKRFKSKSLWTSQGKTVYPKSRAVNKEIRELRRNNALLEKNLKIDGLPEPPKLRKRRFSVGSGTGRPHEKDLGHKRKRLGSVDFRPRKDHMPKWELLGGDAGDPLNLNGLAHSEEGRLLNMKTPESSPLPTPEFRKLVYVRVPPNIEDPLNLEGKHDQRVLDKMLDATIKKRHRSKKKHEKQNSGKADGDMQSETVAETTVCSNVSYESMESSIDTTPVVQDGDKSRLPISESGPAQNSSEITTPTKPGPSASRRSRSISMSPERKFKRQISGGKGRCATQNEPKKFPEKPMFIYGNYNRYYGYRNKDHAPDPRLQHFSPSWFQGKDVLDIGCNVGHITLALAEQFRPNKILGIDIDGKLIRAARQNIRHMLSLRRKDSSKYPAVFELTKGPLEAHPLMGTSDQFPNNVLFLQGNYVPASEEILELQKEEYDTILALSITKWIHLNNGDHGVKLFFRKIFRQLRPGGRLILEPQPWSTYRKRAKLTPDMFNHYLSIKLKPEGFKHYLLSIGFVKCEVIAVPVAKAKGFRRPLIVFTKPDNKQSYSSLDVEVAKSICTACGSHDPSSCVHEFTGIRRGAYASYMYDHVNYPRMSSDHYYDPSTHRGASHGNSIEAEYAYAMGCGPAGVYGGDPFPMPWQRPASGGSRATDSPASHGRSTRAENGERSSGSGSSSSRSQSASERSYSSSYTSGSGSASSRTTASSEYSPLHNGPNGDIAQEVLWEDAVLNADMGGEADGDLEGGGDGDGYEGQVVVGPGGDVQDLNVQNDADMQDVNVQNAAVVQDGNVQNEVAGAEWMANADPGQPAEGGGEGGNQPAENVHPGNDDPSVNGNGLNASASSGGNNDDANGNGGLDTSSSSSGGGGDNGGGANGNGLNTSGSSNHDGANGNGLDTTSSSSGDPVGNNNNNGNDSMEMESSGSS
ncbi:uncharacterized protein LOC101850362 [Aplysia californica]|uniref:RNA methyltransferase n=1 Tax=Aplysia californica TaxID=6500 RepID=A0ABM0K2X7_APLCA|nr:uncharacterized protein LOC101850362 [Aplysia californica]